MGTERPTQGRAAASVSPRGEIVQLRPASAVEVRAAGGVVWRPTATGGRVYAVVHRPAYDDWSLPKGKLAAGESELVAAVREVGEEIGADVAVSRRITTVRYE